ncbi:MAG: pilus assembly protein [Chloroflexi bacterium]|nr:pilus assembly protein [Chloroflexota bacterium]
MKFRKRESGQSLIEFAFVFPIFLGVLIGLMLFAILFYSYVTLHLAVREGASAVVHCPSLNCDTPRLNNGNKLTSIADICTLVRQKTFTLWGSTGTGCAAVGGMTVLVEPPTAQWVTGAQVSVSAAYFVPLPTVTIPVQGSAIRFGTIQIQAQSVMTIE